MVIKGKVPFEKKKEKFQKEGSDNNLSIFNNVSEDPRFLFLSFRQVVFELKFAPLWS